VVLIVCKVTDSIVLEISFHGTSARYIIKTRNTREQREREECDGDKKRDEKKRQ
jgi:hypothetical protein